MARSASSSTHGSEALDYAVPDPAYECKSNAMAIKMKDRLAVSKTHGKELLNGAFVVVQKLDDAGITVRDCETGFETTMPHDRFQEHFLSARAICYATCQAKTIEGTIALHQTGHPHFTRRCLLVGLSRGRATPRGPRPLRGVYR